MHVGGTRAEGGVEFVVRGDPHESVVAAAPCGASGTLLGRLGERLGAPAPGDDVLGHTARPAQEVQGDHRELLRSAALAEDDGVGLGDRQEGAEVGLGFVDHVGEPRGAVGNLERGDTEAGQGHEVALRLLEDREREGRRSRGEVEDALAHDRPG